MAEKRIMSVMEKVYGSAIRRSKSRNFRKLDRTENSGRMAGRFKPEVARINPGYYSDLIAGIRGRERTVFSYCYLYTTSV
jgi:hypothetical protein